MQATYIQVLNRDDKDLEQLLHMLRSWQGKEYVLIDESASVSDTPRLAVLCTNPKHRYELDNLLMIKNETTHSKCIASITHCGDQKVMVEYDLEDGRENQKLMYRHVTMDSLIKSVIEKKSLDLSPDNEQLPAYVEDFDYEALASVADVDYDLLRGFNGRKALFVGTVNFNNANFEQPVCFENAVFYCSLLSFQNACFNNGLSFRNARFYCPTIDFSNAYIVQGILSFEDAAFDTNNVYFDKMNFGKSQLYCFQTIFGLCTVSFVEAKVEDSELYFEDSTLERLIFLNINKLPLTNLFEMGTLVKKKQNNLLCLKKTSMP
jgi:hypothetical protein